MDLGDRDLPRLIGDYILGRTIGSGSFAVVRRARHRQLGIEVAIKEIDKRQLSTKVSENLLKEISILSTINHPNIIRLFEAIQTPDKIYIVLEYCEGGDLAAYIHRHGKVSEDVARHFMRQLAAGLEVLQEKHLIHRDLKPQNLLLSTNELTPQLKIGDFGFARSLMPQGLADTLCGSPLYMAPEIIKNQKYDAKADLWSVGAILFQLVTGRPPFEGTSQFQLFQNILASTELRFPCGAVEGLHPECVDLCRSLLRQNPVERLTFKEFFGHKFLTEPGSMLDIEHSSALPSMKSMVEQAESSSASKKRSQLSSGPLNSSSRSPNSEASSIHGNIQLQRKDCESTSNITAAHGLVPNTAHDGPRKSIDRELYSSSQLKVSDSMECIEKEYVLVNAHSTVIETFSYHLETSLQVSSTTRASRLAPKPNEQDVPVMQTAELAASTVGVTGSSQNQGSVLLHTSGASTMLREVQGLSTLHPSTRLHLLHQYIQVLSELSQEKHDAGLFLESFSVELVVLAIWKKAFEICSAWLNSGSESEPPGSISANESKLVEGGAGLSPNTEEHVDFSRPSSVSTWAEQAFIVAFNRAEKLSYHIQVMDGVAQMPDAMEIIFQKALSVGTSGAVDEFENKESAAAAAYTKAILLLSFIAGEAPSLPLNPQFVLTSANKSRIQQYIKNLQSHQTNLLKSQASLKQSLDAPKK
ncbi:serine/threonine-protein kinase ATG1a [Ziziphus jujuba]|uniref:Serine/threonine-protein kinase ATG1a n=1 Tax=Ziziphus jujuba TaxID=326968 RepID=A0A6P4A218_ZIZJJ|nr:serine/threonine-protein kinase ATG1a [Ziziphus jujuba]